MIILKMEFLIFFPNIIETNKKLITIGQTELLFSLSINLNGIQYVPQNKHAIITVKFGLFLKNVILIKIYINY